MPKSTVSRRSILSTTYKSYFGASDGRSSISRGNLSRASQLTTSRNIRHDSKPAVQLSSQEKIKRDLRAYSNAITLYPLLDQQHIIIGFMLQQLSDCITDKVLDSNPSIFWNKWFSFKDYLTKAINDSKETQNIYALLDFVNNKLTDVSSNLADLSNRLPEKINRQRNQAKFEEIKANFEQIRNLIIMTIESIAQKEPIEVLQAASDQFPKLSFQLENLAKSFLTTYEPFFNIIERLPLQRKLLIRSMTLPLHNVSKRLKSFIDPSVLNQIIEDDFQSIEQKLKKVILSFPDKPIKPRSKTPSLRSFTSNSDFHHVSGSISSYSIKLSPHSMNEKIPTTQYADLRNQIEQLQAEIEATDKMIMTEKEQWRIEKENFSNEIQANDNLSFKTIYEQTQAKFQLIQSRKRRVLNALKIIKDPLPEISLEDSQSEFIDAKNIYDNNTIQSQAVVNKLFEIRTQIESICKQQKIDLKNGKLFLCWREKQRAEEFQLRLAQLYNQLKVSRKAIPSIDEPNDKSILSNNENTLILIEHNLSEISRLKGKLDRIRFDTLSKECLGETSYDNQENEKLKKLRNKVIILEDLTDGAAYAEAIFLEAQALRLEIMLNPDMNEKFLNHVSKVKQNLQNDLVDYEEKQANRNRRHNKRAKDAADAISSIVEMLGMQPSKYLEDNLDFIRQHVKNQYE